MPIYAIYFDNGIRILPENTKTQSYIIKDLLKLANGAKNIYLFSFNVQKSIEKITLPDAAEPYIDIRDWIVFWI